MFLLRDSFDLQPPYLKVPASSDITASQSWCMRSVDRAKYTVLLGAFAILISVELQLEAGASPSRAP